VAPHHNIRRIMRRYMLLTHHKNTITGQKLSFKKRLKTRLPDNGQAYPVLKSLYLLFCSYGAYPIAFFFKRKSSENPVPGKQIILEKRLKDLPFFQKLADKNFTQKT